MPKRRDHTQLVLPPRHLFTDPVAFIDSTLKVNEKGEPWSLMPHQRRVLQLAFAFEQDAEGRMHLPLRLFVYSCPKKSGKTALGAALLIWWSATRSRSETLVVANDAEQAQSRVFKTAVDMCRLNGLEKAGYVRALANVLEFSSGTTASAIASEYAGAAGARQSLVCFDELWAYQHERLQRLYEELTPPPTEENAFALVTTYAGFEGESKLLRAMYDRAMAAERIDDELPIYRDGDYVCYWDDERRMPWQQGDRGARYYAEQAKTLRPNTFRRLHLNQWVNAESVFLTPELWDGCVDSALSPLLASDGRPIFIGVDAATKSDCSAVVGVTWDDDAKLRLAFHKIWRPQPGIPLDLEATVERYLREQHELFAIRAVADPYQLQRSLATLRSVGVDIKELPQTVGNTTAMGEALFDVLKGRNIKLYADSELRQQALNTVAIENTRGWKIAKEKASKKIDGIVALSMAVLSALEAGPESAMPLMVISSAPDSAYVEWETARRAPLPPHPLDDDEDDEDVIEATVEEMQARPDRDQWELVVPRAERRKRHHGNMADILKRDGVFWPGDAQ